MKTRTLAGAILMVAALSPGAASAFHSPEGTVVSDHSFDGSGWAAYRVQVDAGTTLVVDVHREVLDARRTFGGSWLLRENGDLVLGYLTTGYTGFARETHVQGPDPVGVVASERSGGTYGEGGAGVNWSFTAPGRYIIVSVGGSDAPLWTRLRLYARGSAAEILETTTGTRGFAYADSDFRGLASVRVAEPCVMGFAPACPAAGLLVGQAITIPIETAMFGVFDVNLFSAASRWSYAGPGLDGDVTGPNSVAFSNKPPGSYSMRIDASASGPLGGVTAWAFDITLPLP